MDRTSFWAASMLLAVSSGAQAAPIDLAAKGLILGTPILEANGGIGFFEPFLDEFGADFTSGLELTGTPGSEVTFAFSDKGPNEFAISFTGIDLDSYDITEIGFTDMSLEFLIERDPLNLSTGGAGDDAFVRVLSQSFDFSMVSDPLDFFRTGGAVDYDIDVTIQGLNQPAAIPLPAGIVLLGSALIGFGVLRRRT
ncbi:MAG: VPLPA-CTERM sorting domain-containing protein [Paracoccaceae bacterium]